MHSGISRRGLLRGLAAAAGLAGVGLTAGCDLFSGHGQPSKPEVTPELAKLLTGTVALGVVYDAAIARVPALTARLTPLRDAHQAHAKALAQALGVDVPSVTTATDTGSGDQAATLAALLGAEDKGQAAAREACLASSNRLAPLLGTIAAARACHQEVLR